jgi:hypothetical protein
MKITTRNAATLQRHRLLMRAGARMRHITYYRCIVAERRKRRLVNPLGRNGGCNGESATVAQSKNAQAISGLSRNGGKNRIKYAGKSA